MSKKFICGSHKYQIGGPKIPGSKEDTLTLSVSLEGLPERLEVEGCSLSLKTEFHVTLVAIGKIIEKHGVSDPDFIEKVVSDFCEFVQKNSIEFLRYRDEFRFVSRGERRTVVVMCDVSNLEKFFETINKKYALAVEYPPTHVTLYTLQPDTGIFLTDSGDMEHLTKVIPAPVNIRKS